MKKWSGKNATTTNVVQWEEWERRIKTENYFFVPLGWKLIFTVHRGLPTFILLSFLKQLAAKGARWMPFPFHAKRPDDFKCKWGNKIFFFFFYFISTSFFFFLLSFSTHHPPPSLWSLFVVCFSTSPTSSRKKRKWENVFRVADVDGGGEWLFCASAEKNMAWYGSYFCCYLNIKKARRNLVSPPHSSKQHDIKWNFCRVVCSNIQTRGFNFYYY